MITQTRFRLVILGLFLGLIEGILKVLWKSFPLTDVLGFQGILTGAYLGARTVSGVKKIEAKPCVEKTNGENDN